MLTETAIEFGLSKTIEELLRGLIGFFESFDAKTRCVGSKTAQSNANWANGKVEGIISERKLFGD